MAELQSWANLPERILVRVSALLRCRADRVHMARINRHWRAAVRGPQRPPALPPQLPWLIFPNAEVPTFYSAFTGYFHYLRLPADVRTARWLGSFDGDWLVVALATPHAHTHALIYNLDSGERIALPPVFRSPSDDNNNADESPLVVLAATLSASPSNGGAYAVAAIALVGGRPTAAFWTPGRDTWFSTGGPLAEMPQDLIHYAGAFFFLTPREELVVFRFQPAHGRNGGVTLERADLDMRQREGYDDDVQSMVGIGLRKRYLVESERHLLMVTRDIYYEQGTDLLRVFRLSPTTRVANGYRPRCTWEEIFGLNGRMLFLGPGCSRSFEVARYDGFQDQGSMIYFLDESFDSMPFEARQFNFIDMGRYSMGLLTCDSWPPEPLPLWFEEAPPTWWLH